MAQPVVGAKRAPLHAFNGLRRIRDSPRALRRRGTWVGGGLLRAAALERPKDVHPQLASEVVASMRSARLARATLGTAVPRAEGSGAVGCAPGDGAANTGRVDPPALGIRLQGVERRTAFLGVADAMVDMLADQLPTAGGGAAYRRSSRRT
jgi:hypothetical protein